MYFSDVKAMDTLHDGHMNYQRQNDSGATYSNSSSPEQRPAYKRFTPLDKVEDEHNMHKMRGDALTGYGDSLRISHLSSPRDHPSYNHSQSPPSQLLNISNPGGLHEKNRRGSLSSSLAPSESKVEHRVRDHHTSKAMSSLSQSLSALSSSLPQPESEEKQSYEDIDRAMRSVSDRIQARYRK